MPPPPVVPKAGFDPSTIASDAQTAPRRTWASGVALRPRKSALPGLSFLWEAPGAEVVRAFMWRSCELGRTGDESDANCFGGVGSVRCVFCGGRRYVCVDAVDEDGVREISGGVQAV